MPPPRHVPAPWRVWTPPRQPAAGLARRPPLRRGARRGPALPLFALSLVLVLGALAWRTLPASHAADGHPPAGAGPALAPSTHGTASAEPSAGDPVPTTTAPAGDTVSATPGRPASPSVARPATAPATWPVPWTPATALPGGPDATRADVFAALRPGACLAETPNRRSIAVVPCGGPHTDEVTLVRDLTATFATVPTVDQIAVLDEQLCPAAVREWAGGRDDRYTSGYLWWFQEGIPGQAVRRFVCTASLSGHSPFSGTLRRAAA
ncbi:septum formation family protein [Dactylosporangium sp. NPDC000555]|uniref:septum formation family protein n=1 Tax=Dactylosporangium sp. NPDC000555 TaxID=3154260 RepID=UPI00331CEC8F